MRFFLPTKSSKYNVYFTLTEHLHRSTKFSLEILDLCLYFIKYTVEKVDSHTQVVPIYLKIFEWLSI